MLTAILLVKLLTSHWPNNIDSNARLPLGDDRHSGHHDPSDCKCDQSEKCLKIQKDHSPRSDPTNWCYPYSEPHDKNPRIAIEPPCEQSVKLSAQASSNRAWGCWCNLDSDVQSNDRESSAILHACDSGRSAQCGQCVKNSGPPEHKRRPFLWFHETRACLNLPLLKRVMWAHPKRAWLHCIKTLESMSARQPGHHPFLNKLFYRPLLIEALGHSHRPSKLLGHRPIDRPTHQTDDHCRPWHRV